MIVASECSSKLAKIIGKGNPVTVLAAMMLLSCTNFFKLVLTSIIQNLLFGSHNIDATRYGSILSKL